MNTLWIARDGAGRLFWYEIEPVVNKQDGTYEPYRYDWGTLPTDMFPEVTFESGPVEVELKIKEK